MTIASTKVCKISFSALAASESLEIAYFMLSCSTNAAHCQIYNAQKCIIQFTIRLKYVPHFIQHFWRAGDFADKRNPCSVILIRDNAIFRLQIQHKYT